ncbi:hypothetical protein MKW92_003951 [Papaver armeniacum]|nr:hypothetical protein MKW92_003951 [Papaver armeniacum]
MTLSENARLRRKKHAKQNWKNKVKRRKMEAKGQATANVEEGGGHMVPDVEEMGPMVPNVDEGAREFEPGPVDVDFSTVKIRREKVEYSIEEEEKLKELIRGLREFTKNKRKRGIWSELLRLGKDVFKACRTAEDLRLKWRSMEAAGKVD